WRYSKASTVSAKYMRAISTGNAPICFRSVAQSPPAQGHQTWVRDGACVHHRSTADCFTCVLTLSVSFNKCVNLCVCVCVCVCYVTCVCVMCVCVCVCHVRCVCVMCVCVCVCHVRCVCVMCVCVCV